MANGPASAVAKPTIGIMSAGEMGATLGGILVSQGNRVVTTVDARSARTRVRAEGAGLELLPSVAALAHVADVVLSVVPPNAAVDVAARFCSQATPVTNRLYIDLNAIAPSTSLRVDDVCRRHAVRFVDGAIHGMAARLPANGTMYLSGSSAQEAASLFGPFMRVKVLRGPIGQASAFKMLVSGLAKGTVALFVEMALAARQADLLDELLACYREAYPGIMALVERLLPTYPQHAARRGAELHEVEETMRSLGLEPCMVSAAQRITAGMGTADWSNRSKADDASAWPATEVIEALFADSVAREAWQRGEK